MKILFVCKYNRWRSRIAEAYFKKINKNRSISVSSGGIIKGFLPLYEAEVKAAAELGIDILGEPKNISMEQLKEQDKIIVVADDVPREIFSYKWYKDKVEVWAISDAMDSEDPFKLKKNVQDIMQKVDKLVQQLNIRQKGD